MCQEPRIDPQANVVSSRSQRQLKLLVQRAALFLSLLVLPVAGGCSGCLTEDQTARKTWAPEPPAPEIPGCVEPRGENWVPEEIVRLDDWPWWRGIRQDAHAATADEPPTKWSDTENVVWKAEAPGRGHATPIVIGSRVFVSTCDESTESQSLLCYERSTGKQLWHTVVHRLGLMRAHSKNTHASATPASDGERVFTVFPNGDGVWVSALDFDGNILWQVEAGPFFSEHGYGASPVIYRSAVIVSADFPPAGYVTALDRKTGQHIWRKQRDRGFSYSTPAIGYIADRWQLLLSGHNAVTSYNPNDGGLIWTCEGPSEITVSTVAWSNDLVFASGGFPETQVICIRADGSGDVTNSHVVWRQDLKAYVPSPLFVNDRLVLVRDDGVAVGFDPNNGDLLWKERLGGNFSASPGCAGGLVYASNEKGVTFVFRVSPDFQLITENDLGEPVFASPVFLQEQIYIRTAKHLYCIGRRDAT